MYIEKKNYVRIFLTKFQRVKINLHNTFIINHLVNAMGPSSDQRPIIGTSYSKITFSETKSLISMLYIFLSFKLIYVHVRNCYNIIITPPLYQTLFQSMYRRVIPSLLLRKIQYLAGALIRPPFWI